MKHLLHPLYYIWKRLACHGQSIGDLFAETSLVATTSIPVSATFCNMMSPMAIGAAAVMFFSAAIQSKILPFGMAEAVFTLTIGQLPLKTGTEVVTIRAGAVISALA